jgi:hypothetical protein
MRSVIAIVLVVAAVVVFFGDFASGQGQPVAANVAACRNVLVGHGDPQWRSESVVAGPVGVVRRPLRKMWRAPSGNLYTKMGLLVEGHEPVTVSVPAALRNRVFLYYGQMTGRDGKPTTSFADTPGYAATEFRPCSDRPRTIWPGGVRIKGTAPVHLTVEAEGRSMPLRLGKPQVDSPSR